MVDFTLTDEQKSLRELAHGGQSASGVIADRCLGGGIERDLAQQPVHRRQDDGIVGDDQQTINEHATLTL